MSFEELLKSLRVDYLASLPTKIEKIRDQIETGALADIRESFHKLKGTGSTYGMPEVSELAEVVEDVCLSHPDRAPVVARDAVEVLSEIHDHHQRGENFNLAGDPRFVRVRAQLA